MNKSISPAVNEIWSILKETEKQIKNLSTETNKQIKTMSSETEKQIKTMSSETEKQIKTMSSETEKQIKTMSSETEKQIKTMSSETEKQIKTMFAETNKQLKETGKQIKALSAETNKKIKETTEQMNRTDIRINKVVGDFGNRWGKLGENLVKGSLIQRLKERGIEVERVITNAKIGSAEYDIIAINGAEIVVVEVKATLDPLDVQRFTKSIERFKFLWPEFKDKTVYGAMAFLIKANRSADEIARKQGFFVIEATGDIIIQNEEDFKPKTF